MMVRTLCGRGGSIAAAWQGPFKLLRAPAAATTLQKVALSSPSSRQSTHRWPAQKGLPKGGVSCGHTFGSGKSSPLFKSTFLGTVETTNALPIDRVRRSLMEGSSAVRLREGNSKVAVFVEGRQLGCEKIAQSLQIDAPSSLDEAFGSGQVMGHPNQQIMEHSEEAPHVQSRGVVSSRSGRLIERGSRTAASPPTENVSFPIANTSSFAENASSLKMVDSISKDAAPLPNQDTTFRPESTRNPRLESRLSLTLTKRILKGAIELKAVVSSSSPLAKTQESKRTLAEQRSKKRKLGSLEVADSRTSSLESVTTAEVAQSLGKLERGAFTELRIVNEDAFKEHMAYLKDTEQKQRVSTYRTLAGRILSEHLTMPETQNSPTKPLPNQSQTPPIRSSNPSDQSQAPSNHEAAEPSGHRPLTALKQPQTPPNQLLTPSNQGPKPTVQCTDCWLPGENCMCQEMLRLSRPLWPGMRIWMLMHAKEFRRKNNTGKVMWQLFGEESVRLAISGLDILEDEMWAEFAAAGPGRVFLMYPERKAQETMEIFYIDTLPLPSASPHTSPHPTSNPPTNPEALNHATRDSLPSSKPPSLQTLTDGPLEGPETFPAREPDILSNHQRTRRVNVQTPETFQTSETCQTPETSQTPETCQTPETVQTPETSQTPETFQTSETSQTPPVRAADPPPVHFVFLDGTWNNSTAMLVRLQEQAERVWGRKIACLCLTPEAPSKMHSLRPQPALEKVCTAAAASTLLRELSDRPDLSEVGLSDAADAVDRALEVLMKCLQGWRARGGRSPTRGPNRTPAENWVPRERSRSRSPVSESQ